MKEDIVIAKARVVNVGEIELTPMPSVSDPACTAQKNTVIATQLRIEPVSPSPTEGFSQIHGTMTLPGVLPFGEMYQLVLRDYDQNIEQPAGRKFKEE